jgi:Protein of unknown function (DUF2721)
MQLNGVPVQGTQGTMAAIAAAVTPVVMISANAILIGTISAKHQAMADRVRSLAAEWRAAGTSAERRGAIAEQVRIFKHRISWISHAHYLLYVATVFFVAMVIVIALSPVVRTWADFSVPLLLCGVSLMLIAIVVELLDLGKARATVDLETRDVKQESRP